MICVSLSTVQVLSTPHWTGAKPNETPIAFVKPEPVIMIGIPAGPLFGLIFEMPGTNIGVVVVDVVVVDVVVVDVDIGVGVGDDNTPPELSAGMVTVCCTWV